nr:rhamnogalacturonan acetylesterase [Auraticoccus cholistanensis]
MLAGDSTVAACPATETPMSGWGPHLGAPLNRRLTEAAVRAGEPVRTVAVLNTARGGATTESHRQEGLWAALLAELRPQDVVLLQFGHNDSKAEHLAARTGYTTNLERAGEEVLQRGGRPVLCTPVARRRFVEGRLVDTHGDYPGAVRELAGRRGWPCLDLARSTTELYARLGEEGSRALFTHFGRGEHPLYPDGCADDTHFSFDGAVAVAELVAEELAGLWTAAGWSRPAA